METQDICPFCATNDNLLLEGDAELGYFIFCCACSSSGPIHENPEEALNLWSIRSQDTVSFRSKAAKLLPL